MQSYFKEVTALCQQEKQISIYFEQLKITAPGFSETGRQRPG
ncbi:hypothetical protein GGU45_003707 [Niabella hirudinis]